MNKPALQWIAAPLLALGMNSTASASIVCLSPNPVCAAAIVGGLITSAVSARENRGPRQLQAGSRREVLEAIASDIDSAENERLGIRIRKAARYDPGYRAIVRRYRDGRHHGRLSLESLRNFNPAIFDDLDTIEAIIGEHYSRAIMFETYGPKYREDGRTNWRRYATLARDALVIHRQFFAGG